MTRKNKKQQTTQRHPVESLLFLLVGHIKEIFTRSPGQEVTMGIGYKHPDGTFRSTACSIKIEPALSMFASVTPLPSDVSENHRGPGIVNVWDQVTVNGTCEGNRHGGAQAYAKAMAPIFIEAAQCGSTVELSTPATIEVMQPEKQVDKQADRA